MFNIVYIRFDEQLQFKQKVYINDEEWMTDFQVKLYGHHWSNNDTSGHIRGRMSSCITFVSSFLWIRWICEIYKLWWSIVWERILGKRRFWCTFLQNSMPYNFQKDCFDTVSGFSDTTENRKNPIFLVPFHLSSLEHNSPEGENFEYSYWAPNEVIKIVKFFAAIISD